MDEIFPLLTTKTVFGNGKIIAHIAHECATTKKTLYSCENVTKMWNLGDWGCCDPFRWGKPDSWDDQRAGANLRKFFFLVFWTRTFMAFMIKDKAHFELFDLCMRFLKMKSWWDSPQHWKCRSKSSRCDRRKWKTERKRIIFLNRRKWKTVSNVIQN